MILLAESSLFVDPLDGSTHDIHPIPRNYCDMVPMEYYVIGNYVYQYIGTVFTKKIAEEGSIYKLNGAYYITEYEDDEKAERFHEDNVISKKRYYETMHWSAKSIEDTAKEYLNEHNTNLVEQNRNKLLNTGDVFIPELKETDDPMERVIKLMVLQMQLKLNERRGSFDKEYSLDNLRSALNGATKNMSILKFLMWCELLNLDWEFDLINTEDGVFHPLPEPVVISNHSPLNMEIPEEVKKGVFNVPIAEGDDPLKRLIKVAIFKKVVYLKDYKQRGTTAHLINNMRSGLKGKQKMSIPCAMNWCEILDMVLIIKVTNPATGVWYKSIGYEMYTNVPDDKNATYVEEKG